MEAMGQNVHFVIDSWMEGEKLTATVIWHLGDHCRPFIFVQFHPYYQSRLGHAWFEL